MNQKTIDGIRIFLESDDSVPKNKIDTILRSIQQTTAPRRHLIGAKEAMDLLSISRPTLRKYVHQGLITQVAFSSRKIRFDEDEIRRFASNGAPTEGI